MFGIMREKKLNKYHNMFNILLKQCSPTDWDPRPHRFFFFSLSSFFFWLVYFVKKKNTSGKNRTGTLR